MDLGWFLALILICHVLSLSAHEGSKSTPSCPVNFQCGNLSRVNFPFFNLSYPRRCGLCMVDCEAKPSPKVALGIPAEQWFEAKSIDNSIIKLYDPKRQDLLSSQDCKLFHNHIRLPNSPSISYSILQSITLYRCSINPETRQRLTDLFSGYTNYDECDRINNFTIFYQNPEHHPPQVAFNAINQSNCTALVFPIVSGYKDSEHLGLFDLLTAEFDLQWHVSDDCYNCYREGNMCRIDWSTESRCANAVTGKKNLKFILGTASSVGGFAILVILAYCFKRFSFCGFVDVLMHETEKYQDIENFVKNYESLAPKRYRYSDVKKMTNSFKIKLGQGGYGSVYKGKLHNCSPVAVKVLKESKGSGEEFINEVASISRTSHVNIVNLLGFCYEGRKRALIYEFMPNGSLDKFIYGGKSSTDRQLSVQTLYKISVGIARGLEYLHSGCNTRILHFDIKPHNILLDRDFVPKISDFGLAKLCPSKESIVSMLGARGTVGYIAPEVFCKYFGGVSHKSDVYSYGMMVFEMIGGRKNIDVGVDHTSEIYFPDWIYKKIDQCGNLGLEGITNEEENELARKMIIVSLWCIQTDPSNRPSMTKVVEMLEGSHQALQIPPKPFLFSPSGASNCISTVNMT